MLVRNVVDQLLNQNRLTNAGTAEQTNLTTLEVRCDQVNNLDTGFKNLRRSRLLFVARCGTMDRPVILYRRSGLFVNRLTQQVENTSQCFLADRNLNRAACIYSILAADKAIRTAHCNAANGIIADMLCDLKNKTLSVEIYFNCIQQFREMLLLKANVHDGTDNLHNLSDILHNSNDDEPTVKRLISPFMKIAFANSVRWHRRRSR